MCEYFEVCATVVDERKLEGRSLMRFAEGTRIHISKFRGKPPTLPSLQLCITSSLTLELWRAPQSVFVGTEIRCIHKRRARLTYRILK